MKPFSPLRECDYDRALELWPSELMRRVKNVMVFPTWIEGEERFWIKVDTNKGHEFLVVDAFTGERRPAFDHELVAKALDADAAALPILHFDYLGRGSRIRAQVRERESWVEIDLNSGELADVRGPSPTYLVGPDGRELFVNQFNLWIREPDGTEKALTEDGERFFAWGSMPDHNYSGVIRDRESASMVPTGTSWSPDGQLVLTQQTDERHVEGYPYVEWTPADGSPRPKIHHVKMRIAGESEDSVRRWYLLDTNTGARTRVADLEEGIELDITRGQWWWSPDGGTVYTLASNLPSEDGALVEVDTASGDVRIVFRERSATFFGFNTFTDHAPNVRVLHDRGQAIWYSQRTGFGHLYLLDLATGEIVRAITEGEWAVFDLLLVTDSTLFFAGGREDGVSNPYYRHLYRVDLDGKTANSNLVRLTTEDADHGFIGAPTHFGATSPKAYLSPMRMQLSPSGEYFVDSTSRVDLPTVTTLRRTRDGETIAVLAEADITSLTDIGWSMPEVFRSTAADGFTAVWGVLIRPRHFNDRESWPVLERIYGGAWTIAQPRSFAEGLNGSFMFGLHALADMGFVVAVLDGPGTPYRSKSFHDMTWDKADRWGIADHRAALEGAAAERPWMDLSNVGISGHSYGGYGVVMAMLLEPDFYRVGVSTSGMYDAMRSDGPTEYQLGRPLYEGGRRIKKSPGERPINWLKFSPEEYADRLEGELLLAFGNLDENIQPAALLSFVNALTAEGKDVDLLYMPERSHHYTTDPYLQKRLWDYFVQYVQRRAPLRHKPLGVVPGERLYRFG
ncbi:S9 family peptidase [Microbacterium oxydans]|uniref:S9 family peptidase n=1 Tax=Microbacterium oxydans TaxID=82380 RepID=UPI000F8F8A5A|nr:DPP IV N-terminal domain-containing protein [Microbacterium oxydans]AZS48001.1 Prolyl tripeptidyl peptidase [Microbacterium oxydans]